MPSPPSKRGGRWPTTSQPIPNPTFRRVILIVLDGVGCGELPDAASYGDEGSNTLGNLAQHVPLRIPYLRALGLGRVVDLHGPPESVVRDDDVIGAYGRMAEASPGKDSVTGHWEMTGVVLDRAFPTFPHGFPRATIEEFERRIGRGTLGNVVASGTEIIERLGAEHVRTGKPIVYTSADSVFQIAAHEDVIPLAEQYRNCEIAFDLVSRGMGVGRVIARPFVGEPGAFRRTSNRHDYALEPYGETLLDRLTSREVAVTAIGKIKDLFAGRGITRAIPTASDAEGMQRIRDVMSEARAGFIFVNLVDFDTQFGHRNDTAGYAANLERFDQWLGPTLQQLQPDDLLIVTGDHGNDPTTPSTDHSREHVPVLLTGARVRRPVDIGTRSTFADLGQTVSAALGVGPLAHGSSFLEDIVVHDS
jgi:phosphopentomutase